MKKRKNFTLIEILIALGVCAIGVCSIMVLFPIAANDSRDASMESFSANSAEMVLNWHKYALQNGWSSTTVSLGTLEGKSFVADDKNSWIHIDNELVPKGFFKLNTDSNIFQLVSYNKTAENSTDIDSVDDDRIDNRIIIYLAREQIPLIPSETGASMNVNTDYGIRLVLEATWPAELPYANRNKATYTLDVFNPQSN